MSDLINGRELLKRYQEDLCYGIACKDCSMCTEDGGCRVEEWIDKFPSTDRPQGEWIIHYRDKWMVRAECPKCHRRFKFSPRAIWKRCPMCETRMKGANDE